MSRDVRTFRYKTDDFKHALIYSTHVERGIIGIVYFKSRDIKIKDPPKRLSVRLKSFSVLFI